MKKSQKKKGIFVRIRNNFIAGVVVLIPIGITLYLTLILIRISGKIIPKEINKHPLPPIKTITGIKLFLFNILILNFYRGQTKLYF